MAISFDDRVRPVPDVLMREVDGEAVFLSLGNERYFGLDDVGTRMWSALVAAESIGAAYEVLVREYDVEPDTLRRDLEALIDRLVESGLARIDAP